ncbi:hypothetical protein TrVE_jg8250 [Triparma verrucosa]|uniref:Uncharacterized protein n=1 Tax=Triparma verrucosa TaxID=1606542 RepID=A0A9W7EYZ4_9STRA|nr:hypothetical protein TrVE_jg8250 [Triparma verrucosa]
MFFPVPGGPCSMRWRKGALFFFVLLVATAIFSSCVERLFSSTIPSSAFFASLKPRIWRPLFTGSLRNCETVILLVSLTRLGLPKFALLREQLLKCIGLSLYKFSKN